MDPHSVPIFYPDLYVNAPETDMHGLQVQVNGGWGWFVPHPKIKIPDVIDCRVVKAHTVKGCRWLDNTVRDHHWEPGQIAWVNCKFLTSKKPICP